MLKKNIYPFIYFYDLAVVDYTRFENREKLIQKKTYELASGLDANFESEQQKNNSELVEITTDVFYMDYLKEAIFYYGTNSHLRRRI